VSVRLVPASGAPWLESVAVTVVVATPSAGIRARAGTSVIPSPEATSTQEPFLHTDVADVLLQDLPSQAAMSAQSMTLSQLSSTPLSQTSVALVGVQAAAAQVPLVQVPFAPPRVRHPLRSQSGSAQSMLPSPLLSFPSAQLVS